MLSRSHANRLTSIGLFPEQQCILSTTNSKAVASAASALGIDVARTSKQTQCAAIASRAFAATAGDIDCDRCHAIVMKTGTRCRNKARCKSTACETDAESIRMSTLLCSTHFDQWKRGAQVSLFASSEQAETAQARQETTAAAAAADEAVPFPSVSSSYAAAIAAPSSSATAAAAATPSSFAIPSSSATAAAAAAPSSARRGAMLSTTAREPLLEKAPKASAEQRKQLIATTTRQSDVLKEMARARFPETKTISQTPAQLAVASAIQQITPFPVSPPITPSVPPPATTITAPATKTVSARLPSSTVPAALSSFASSAAAPLTETTGSTAAATAQSPQQPPVLSDQDRQAISELKTLNDIVSDVVTRIKNTESLIKRWCKDENEKNAPDLQSFRASEQRVAQLVTRCSKSYTERGVLDLACVQKVQDYYNNDFKPLEARLHEQLENACTAPGRFVAGDLSTPRTDVAALQCDKEKVPQSVQSWFTRADDNLLDKKIYCHSLPEGDGEAFQVLDELPRGNRVFIVDGKFIGIAKVKEVKDEQPSTWRQSIASASIGAMQMMQSALWKMIQFALGTVGYTADLLAMLYQSLSYRIVLTGMALTAGLLSLPFITSFGLVPIMQLAYYGNMLCQMASTPAVAVGVASLVAYGLQRQGANEKAYMSAFAQTLMTLTVLGKYCNILQYLGSILSSVTPQTVALSTTEASKMATATPAAPLPGAPLPPTTVPRLPGVPPSPPGAPGFPASLPPPSSLPAPSPSLPSAPPSFPPPAAGTSSFPPVSPLTPPASHVSVPFATAAVPSAAPYSAVTAAPVAVCTGTAQNFVCAAPAPVLPRDTVSQLEQLGKQMAGVGTCASTGIAPMACAGETCSLVRSASTAPQFVFPTPETIASAPALSSQALPAQNIDVPAVLSSGQTETIVGAGVTIAEATAMRNFALLKDTQIAALYKCLGQWAPFLYNVISSAQLIMSPNPASALQLLVSLTASNPEMLDTVLNTLPADVRGAVEAARVAGPEAINSVFESHPVFIAAGQARQAASGVLSRFARFYVRSFGVF